MNCQTQDLLEAAIVQKRRLKISCVSTEGEKITYHKVLPIDINTLNGVEHLTVLTTDNEGGILKLSIDTSQINYFEAIDSKTPVIKFAKF